MRQRSKSFKVVMNDEEYIRYHQIKEHIGVIKDSEVLRYVLQYYYVNEIQVKE